MLSRKLLNFATLLPLLLLNNSIYNNIIFQNHCLPTIPNPSHQTPFPIPSSKGKVILFFPFHVVSHYVLLFMGLIKKVDCGFHLFELCDCCLDYEYFTKTSTSKMVQNFAHQFLLVRLW
ncbi:hypothetical protein S245_037848 [Arachis hypogaea]